MIKRTIIGWRNREEAEKREAAGYGKASGRLKRRKYIARQVFDLMNNTIRKHRAREDEPPAAPEEQT